MIVAEALPASILGRSASGWLAWLFPMPGATIYCQTMFHGGSSMSATNTVQERNRELADQINAEARSNPQSPYANKFVGIANGQVVVVADDLDQMIRRLRQIEPDPSKTFGVEASRDYDEVIEIWELH
jgi:hypothetical protein